MLASTEAVPSECAASCSVEVPRCTRRCPSLEHFDEAPDRLPMIALELSPFSVIDSSRSCDRMGEASKEPRTGELADDHSVTTLTGSTQGHFVLAWVDPFAMLSCTFTSVRSMRLHTRLARAKDGLERRMFLKALAFGASLPVAAKLARFATAETSAAPKRLFVFYVPHGVAPEHVQPRIIGGDNRNFVLDDTNVSIWGPLEPYKSHVTVYEGFQYPGDAETHDGLKNCLSGITANDETTPRTSFERVIANALGVSPLILGACAHPAFGLDANSKLFWDGTPIDPEKDPSRVADQLFGNLGNGGTPPPMDANVELRRELLGLTSSEIQALRQELNGLTREQNKLQSHLDAIEALRSSGNNGGVVSCTSVPSMPAVERVRSESFGQVIDPSGGNDYFYQERNFPLLFEAALEVATQAIICNAASIIGLQPMYATCEFDFGFAGAPGSHHNTLSHTQYQAAPGAQWDSPITIDNLKPETRVPFATAQRWFFEKLVEKMVSVLATTDDPAAPGTTVLDNTVIYCFSEIGDGQDHKRVSRVVHPQWPAHLPLITIGRAGGALDTGQVIPFPIGLDDVESRAVNRPAGDLYLTLARALGAGNITLPNTTGVIEEALT